MSGNPQQKLKLLKIFDILNQYSDEQHPISAGKICNMLAGQGIYAERKSVYNDIGVLRDNDYDVIATRLPSIGYFIGERLFEVPELYLLSDAVQSAAFITPKKSKELIEKLSSLTSIHQAAAMKKQVHIDNRAKCNNEEIYYSIDAINRAIEDAKIIELNYSRRTLSGNQISVKYKKMTLSPYALFWAGDHYYLVCNNVKYNNLMHLRLDKIKSVSLTDTTSRHFSEVSNYKNYFDIADYLKKSFNVFVGEVADLELICSMDMLEQCIDKFGEDTYIKELEGEGKFKIITKAMISEGLVGWILQFAGDIEVKSPKKLRESVAASACRLSRIHG